MCQALVMSLPGNPLGTSSNEKHHMLSSLGAKGYMCPLS